jgi:hypothetical protein
MNIYRNIVNDSFYTMRIVEAIPTMMEATPYLTNGQVIKYPVLSSTASDFVRFSPEAIEAYNNSKTNL